MAGPAPVFRGGARFGVLVARFAAYSLAIAPTDGTRPPGGGTRAKLDH